MSKPISIREIAVLSGTSIATVSRIINQKGRFSKETEERVLKVMKELDYQPNALARGLRQNKLNMIGVVVPDITLSFFSELYHSIEAELYRLGYLSILVDTNENEQVEREYIENLSCLKIAGLIYLNGKRHRPAGGDFPILYADRYPGAQATDIHFIGCNNLKGGLLAARALLEAGRTRPAIVRYDKDLATQRQRYLGFRQALEEQGLSLDDARIIRADAVNMAAGYELTRDLCQRTQNFDSIFYTSDIFACGGIRYLNEAGIRVPEDISIIGMDDTPLSSILHLTTIRQPVEEMGILAADSIVSLINGEKIPLTQTLDVKLVERNTL